MSMISCLEHRAIHFIVKRPKSLIVIAAVVFLVLFVGFESLRARLYDVQVDDYRNSTQVQALNGAVTRLAAEAQRGSKPEFCSLSLEGNLGGYNAAYKTEPASSETAFQMVHARAEAALPSPTFYSLLNFLPHIDKRDELSQQLKEGIETSRNLTRQDARSVYCLRLLDVLSEVYFLKSVSRPEGVAALRVGQVENFQTNVKKAQTSLRSIPPPKEMSDEHSAIAEIFNRLALHLREDENDYVTFSRRIELQTQELEMTLESISNKTTDLQAVPAQLYLITEIVRQK